MFKLNNKRFRKKDGHLKFKIYQKIKILKINKKRRENKNRRKCI